MRDRRAFAFTLVELIVAIGLAIMLLTMLAYLLRNVSRASTRATAIVEMSARAGTLLQLFESDFNAMQSHIGMMMALGNNATDMQRIVFAKGLESKNIDYIDYAKTGSFWVCWQYREIYSPSGEYQGVILRRAEESRLTNAPHQSADFFDAEINTPGATDDYVDESKQQVKNEPLPTFATTLDEQYTKYRLNSDKLHLLGTGTIHETGDLQLLGEDVYNFRMTVKAQDGKTYYFGYNGSHDGNVGIDGIPMDGKVTGLSNRPTEVHVEFILSNAPPEEATEIVRNNPPLTTSKLEKKGYVAQRYAHTVRIPLKD